MCCNRAAGLANSHGQRLGPPPGDACRSSPDPGGRHAACQRGAAFNTRPLRPRRCSSPPPGSSGWSGVHYRVSGGVARGTPTLGVEHRSTLASSVVAWTIDPLGRRSGSEHRLTEASSAVASNAPLARSIGWPHRWASSAPTRYRIPSIAETCGSSAESGSSRRSSGTPENSGATPTPKRKLPPLLPCGKMTAVDPRSNASYVLVGEAEYETVRDVLEDERRQRSIRRVALRNAIGRMGDLP